MISFQGQQYKKYSIEHIDTHYTLSESSLITLVVKAIIFFLLCCGTSNRLIWAGKKEKKDSGIKYENNKLEIGICHE